jgi:protein-tyrosine-phosphatase
MAMGLLRAKVDPAENWKIESAGLWALGSYSAAQNTQLVLKERCINLSAHRSSAITLNMLENFNLILTMEKGHKEALKAAFPKYAGRIYLLNEMIGKTDDIIDPIGGELTDFEDTAREIEQILTLGYDRICQLAESASE